MDYLENIYFNLCLRKFLIISIEKKGAQSAPFLFSSRLMYFYQRHSAGTYFASMPTALGV